MGLKWLQTMKQETGLKACVEVANAHHVELCLEAGIDVLWVGARSTVNPFTVQEIADAVKGVDIPIMVKNQLTGAKWFPCPHTAGEPRTWFSIAKLIKNYHTCQFIGYF